jgi:outer membrane protein assembly factor BamB
MRSCAILVVLCLTTAAAASDWPQFRGPFFNGSTDEKGLPDKWSQTDNVAWTATLPGPSAATPIVSGDRVFVSTADAANDTLAAYCLDRRTGKVVWKHDVAKGIRKDTRSTFSSPSPATDGKVVVFFYGNGDLVTFDVSGKELWKKNVGPFAFLWTFSTSPVLYDGKLYLQVLQRDVPVSGYSPFGKGKRKGKAAADGEAKGKDAPGGKIESFLLALDPQTGKELWRHVRPAHAVAESLEAFTTPMPWEHDGRKELLIAGGDALTGHDPQTGKELWRWETWNPTKIGHWRLVPSPVAGGDVVLACAPKGDPIYAVKAGGQGKLGGSDVAWVSREQRPVSSDVPTPAFYDGDFFVLSDVRQSLSRVEPATGRVKWTIKTPGRAKYEASPLAADGKIYLVNFDGQVSVIDAADGKLRGTIAMEESREEVARSSIIAAHGQLFIRTARKLYCVGK